MARRVLLLMVAVAMLVAPATAWSARPLIVTTVDTHKLGPRIPDHFLGFSGEWQLLRRYVTAGDGTGTVNGSFAALARDLSGFGGGMPVIRFGGGTTDTIFFD